MDLATWQYALAGLAAFFVGCAKCGVPGVGVLVVPMMATAIGDGFTSVGFLLPLLISADCFAVWWYRQHAQWDRLWRLFPGVLLGAALGGVVLYFFGRNDLGVAGMNLRDWFTPLIGLIVLVMIIIHLIRKRHQQAITPNNPVTVWATGLGAGAATTIANAAGPIMTVYLAGMKMPKEQFMGTNAWFFLLINLTKVPLYIFLSLLPQQTPLFTGASLWLNLCLVPLILCGAFTGRWVFAYIPQKLFDSLILALAAVAALKLLLTPWIG